MNNLYVHYGCGLDAPEGWLNFDASPSLVIQKIPLIGRLSMAYLKTKFPGNVHFGDISKRLPGVPDGAVKGIYCSHVLEHLSLEDFRKAIRNTYTMLQEEGIFRLVVPDLEYYIDTYQKSNDNERALQFMKDTILGVEKRQKGLKSAIGYILGNAKHLWMWDFHALKVELENAGFRQVRRCQYGDCEDPAFLTVENPARFRASVGIECRK